MLDYSLYIFNKLLSTEFSEQTLADNAPVKTRGVRVCDKVSMLEPMPKINFQARSNPIKLLFKLIKIYSIRSRTTLQ